MASFVESIAEKLQKKHLVWLLLSFFSSTLSMDVNYYYQICYREVEEIEMVLGLDKASYRMDPL